MPFKIKKHFFYDRCDGIVIFIDILIILIETHITRNKERGREGDNKHRRKSKRKDTRNQIIIVTTTRYRTGIQKNNTNNCVADTPIKLDAGCPQTTRNNEDGTTGKRKRRRTRHRRKRRPNKRSRKRRNYEHNRKWYDGSNWRRSYKAGLEHRPSIN